MTPSGRNYYCTHTLFGSIVGSRIPPHVQRLHTMLGSCCNRQLPCRLCALWRAAQPAGLLQRGRRAVSTMHLWERCTVAAGAAVVALLDPSRADMVALLGELTGGPALGSMHQRMRALPSGVRILENQPRITRAVAFPVGGYPPGSFGDAYSAYMAGNGFDPEDRHTVKFVEDPQLRYVLQRYREVHDFWHVLSGLPPTVVGELAVKWLEMLQTGLPMPALSAVVGPIRLSAQDRALLLKEYVPWALRVSHSAEYLMAVEYEALLPLPLDQVRKALRFEPCPAVAAT